ncbi:MAG: hypothetical protein AB1765_13250 [Candidatus Hydrogenedentota bacterium]
MNSLKKLILKIKENITFDHILILIMVFLTVLAVFIWLNPDYKKFIEEELHKKITEQKQTN